MHFKWSSFDDPEDSDPQEIHVEPIKLLAKVRPSYNLNSLISEHSKGWTCDSKEPRMEGGCPNQDIIDKVCGFGQCRLPSHLSTV